MKTLNNVKALRDRLVELNKVYREGNPEVSDREYDELVEKLRSISPDDEFFKRGIVEQATERMEPLPMPMYSLEKIKKVGDFRKWVQKMADAGCIEIIATPKFDGISLLTYDRDGNQAWTRGDGVKGQRSDLHFSKMNNGKPNGYFSNVYTWGEAICKKKSFEHLKEKLNVPYKNARNMVAGVFNSPDGYKNSVLPFIDFVRYGINVPINKDIQLKVLRNRYQNVTIFKKYEISDLLRLCDEELNELIDLELHHEFNNEYKIDGVVFEVNEYSVREKLGRLPNGNPVYAIAFKRPEWCDTYFTKVIDIEYGVSKDGVINPVIIVEPVEMDGATVSRVTGYNMAYMIDNNIHVGATIEIMRSGDVIPKHIRTIEFSEAKTQEMIDNIAVCPSCGTSLGWDKNYVNLVCTNENCKEKVINQLVYFFRTMGCEEFEEPTIRKMYNDGWCTIDDVFEASEEQCKELLGKSKGKTVSDQITKVLTGGVPMAQYLTALNLFEGQIAQITCQKILDGISEEHIHLVFNEGKLVINIKELVKISGVGLRLGYLFYKGIHQYLSLNHRVTPKITYIQTPKNKVKENALKVCFTGFRNKAWEEQLKERGDVVLNGVTKECNLLVVADLNSTSSKMETAKKRGIKIMSKEEFENEVLLQR